MRAREAARGGGPLGLGPAQVPGEPLFELTLRQRTDDPVDLENKVVALLKP